jgi:hypothetical protein
VPLTLNIRLADKSTVKVEVSAEVKPLTAPMGEHMQHMHH